MRLALSSRSLTEGSLAAAIQRVAELEIDGLEVWIEDMWRRDEAPHRLAALAREYGIQLSAYAPVGDVNIIAPDAADRERSMRWAVEAVATARRMGASILTLDPGHLVDGVQTLASGWRPLISAARTIAKAAEDQGVRVGLENPAPAPDRVLTHLVDAQSLLREVESPYLGVGLNLSHLSASSAEDPVDWLGGLDRVFQIRVTPDRPRRTLQPVLGGAKQRALFVDRLEGLGFRGQVVLDDPQTAADSERLVDAIAQIRRWFIVRRSRSHSPRRASVARRSGTPA